MTVGERVVAEARTYMLGKGTRWRHQGRTKYVGVDCLGLIGMAALAVGCAGAAEWRSDPRFHNYARTPDVALVNEGCERFMLPLDLADLRVGDVLVMRWEVHPQHFALVSRLDPIYVIHAYASRSAPRVVENGVAVAGTSIVRAHRFKGLA